jgi:hypothetical protein
MSTAISTRLSDQKCAARILRRRFTALICTIALLDATAFAQSPATQPALPPGHPAMPTEQAEPALPPGHPQMPTNPGQGMPAGHPGVGDPNLKGILNLKVLQATQGGPAISGDSVVIEYYSTEGQLVGRSQGKLSSGGVVKFSDVPAGLVVQPLITVNHGNVAYRSLGEWMDSQRRAQDIEMHVFESTDKEPDWHVRMRHVILTPSPEGVAVTEMISVANPTDRSWTGTLLPEGRSATIAIPLPAGAAQFQSNTGLAESGGKAVYLAPMQPGSAEFQYSYFVPAKNDAVQVTLTAPTATDSIFVFLPEDGTTVEGANLKKVEVKPGMSLRENSRFYTASPQNRGESLNLNISNLKSAKPIVPPTPPAQDTAQPQPAQPVAPAGKSPSSSAAPQPAGIPSVAKLVGGIGAVAVVGVGVAVVVVKARSAGK